VTVNQRQNGGQWVLLGTFTFNAASGVTTDGYVYDSFGNNAGRSGSTVNTCQYGGAGDGPAFRFIGLYFAG